MRFIETPLPGVWIIEPERLEDERGFFARTWCRSEFEARGLNADLEQCNIAFNAQKGTLRGMHWQATPHGEAKLIRCTRGAVWDVALDLRPASPMFLKWFGVELSAQNRRMFFIPEGLAHGLQTLEDSSEMFYQMSTNYHAPSVRGARFDDPAFAIEWPLPISIIAEKDKSWPLWKQSDE
jgi:dTDP-4-dehydrorhamnose 3,5-epimerase